MLTELLIRNLGVIDEAELRPARGLSVVTGETGAGKTMVVSGITLVSGARAGSGLVRHGHEKAVIEATFSDLDDAWEKRVDDLGGQLDEGDLLVARHLSPQRSRAFVGGAQVPAGAAGDVVRDLVTVHGQAEQIRLGTPERQREVLDRSAGPEHLKLLRDYGQLYATRRDVIAEADRLKASSAERAREADHLRFSLAEIASVDPQPGEDVELLAELRRLTSVDELRAAAHGALMALSGDEDALDSPGACGLVARAQASLQGVEDGVLAAQGEELSKAGYALGDVVAELSRFLADLEADPARLAFVNERVAALKTLTRKYGDSVDDVLAWADTSATRLLELDGGEEHIGELTARIEELDVELQALAAKITQGRQQAGERLSAAVGTELAALAMPHARIVFDLTPLSDLAAYGAESVALLFAANPGSAPGPLGKVASGGELSRVRLALEVILADTDPGHTFVFDEVDAGVGGATGLEIGRRLARLAQHSQVLVVTHLAQVAAFADAHFVVKKESDGHITSSGITEVTGEAREEELARMMGGLAQAASAREHARELLNEAGR